MGTKLYNLSPKVYVSAPMILNVGTGALEYSPWQQALKWASAKSGSPSMLPPHSVPHLGIMKLARIHVVLIGLIHAKSVNP